MRRILFSIVISLFIFIGYSFAVTHDGDCNQGGYCYKPHCDSRVYCTRCGHNCDGDHKFTKTCTKGHCSDYICTVSGCTSHQTDLCGGDHVKGEWKEVAGVHKNYCGVAGCTTQLESHNPIWGFATNHIATCLNGCGLTKAHTPTWSEWFLNGDKHYRNCLEANCSVSEKHEPNWSEYVKADNGGEESDAEHVKRCTVEGCKLETGRHVWPSASKWYSVNETYHKRTCPTCSITQTLEHEFMKSVSIEEDIEYHNRTCVVCVDQEENEYSVKEKHVDEEDGVGNGICDLCNKHLWKVVVSNTEVTNKDITIEILMYSYKDDKIKNADKMIDGFGVETTSNTGIYTISKDGQYTFCFTNPNREVSVTVNNISKDIYGKIYTSGELITTDKVKLKLIVSNEGYDKDIDLRFEDEATWEENVLEIEREVSNNGTYKFYAKDSLGNNKIFTIDVDNIVSGFGSVTTTYNILQQGYVFTDVLVNVNSAWQLTDPLVNCFESAVKIYRVDDNKKIEIPKLGNIVVKDEFGNKVNGSILKTGIYYLNVSFGGMGVFDEPGTYMVELVDVKVKVGENSLFTLEGKNRIEVIVQRLNDLT